MTKRLTFQDFIKFAIEQEQAAAQLYSSTAKGIKERAAKTLLDEMAAMERGHEARLRALLGTGMSSMPRPGEVKSRAIADFTVETTLTPDSAVQDVFLFAIKAEQKAADLYTYLGAFEAEPETQRLLLTMAEEEKKHKADLEDQYERGFMRDN